MTAFNVRDYGALGDGMHDDTDAVAACRRAAGNHDVILPEGKYRLRSPDGDHHVLSVTTFMLIKGREANDD